MSWQKDVRKRCEQEEGRTEQACTTQEGPERAGMHHTSGDKAGMHHTSGSRAQIITQVGSKEGMHHTSRGQSGHASSHRWGQSVRESHWWVGAEQACIITQVGGRARTPGK